VTESFAFTSFERCRTHLAARLDERPPTRIQVLVGPRQVGKTTLLLEVARQRDGRAHYVAADSPDAALPGFWERTWHEAERRAEAGPTVLLIDEIQHVGNWSARLKGQWDRVRERGVPLHLVASGSSALQTGAGSRESLAGRFERTLLTHWSAGSLSDAFGVSPEEAARAVVSTGGYPGAFPLRDELPRWRAYLRDSILEPAIGRDILATRTVHRPALLRQLFAMAASLPASIVSLQKLQGTLQDRGALETLQHYLALLGDAFIVAALPKFSTRAHRLRSSPPKLIVLDNGLLGAATSANPPTEASDPVRFGAWVENACIAFAVNSGQQVSYWREEPFEVDAIIEGSWGKWAVEVTTGDAIGHVRGLAEFTSRHPEYQLLLVTSGRRDVAVPSSLRRMAWTEFLLRGPQ
jgi:uncharacterized protein